MRVAFGVAANAPPPSNPGGTRWPPASRERAAARRTRAAERATNSCVLSAHEESSPSLSSSAAKGARDSPTPQPWRVYVLAPTRHGFEAGGLPPGTAHVSPPARVLSRPSTLGSVQFVSFPSAIPSFPTD